MNSDLILDEKLTHQLKVADGKAFSEFPRQLRGKFLEKCFPVSGPLCAFLFVIHNPASDLEVGQHLQGVDRAGRSAACGDDKAAQLADERAKGAAGSIGLGDDGFLLYGHGLFLRFVTLVLSKTAFDLRVREEVQVYLS